jgi:hypothetical protein
MADSFVYAGDKVPIGGTLGQVLTKTGAPHYYTGWRDLPTISGTVVTTDDSGSVTGIMIANNTITNVNINSAAAIAYSKLSLSSGIVNADISASAAIAHSKLASLTAASVLLGNVSNVPTATAITGDVTISNAGVVAIASGVIINADISASAGIIDTKLATISTAGKVSNSATTATNANSTNAIVLRDGSGNFSAGTITANLTGASSGNVRQGGGSGQGSNIVYIGWLGSQLGLQIDVTNFGSTWPIGVTGNASTVTTNANLTGDVTSVGNETSISSGAIVNADINTSAAIAYSKLGAMTAASILLGNASNIPTVTAVTGDITINSTGVTAIGNTKVTNAMLAGSIDPIKVVGTAMTVSGFTSGDFDGILDEGSY